MKPASFHSVIILFLLVCCSSLPSMALKYVNPVGKRFPIMAWFSILPDSEQTKARYQELADAGFNLSFPHFGSLRSLQLGLHACKGTGVKLMGTCHEEYARPEETARRMLKERDFAGWFLRDEPVCSGFKELKKLSDRLASVDSVHMQYLNLLPNYVEVKHLGADSYIDYVRRFAREVNIGLLSYDNYPVVSEGDKISLRSLFYSNLEDVRKVSLETGQPFWAFALATAHGAYPVPTKEQLKLQIFSNLAYGAQGLQYFTYWTPLGTIWDFHNAPIDSSGHRTNVYYLIKEVNSEVRALTRVFLGCRVNEVCFTGGTIPEGTRRLTAMPAPLRRLASGGGEGLLVSRLSNAGREYVLILNRDVNHAQKVEIEMAGRVTRLIPVNGRLKKQKLSGILTETLPSGSYILLQKR